MFGLLKKLFHKEEAKPATDKPRERKNDSRKRSAGAPKNQENRTEAADKNDTATTSIYSTATIGIYCTTAAVCDATSAYAAGCS